MIALITKKIFHKSMRVKKSSRKKSKNHQGNGKLVYKSQAFK